MHSKMSATPTNTKPRLALGADHAGYRVKERIKSHLQAAGYTVTDFGTESEESVDYPDFGRRVAESVAAGQHDLGIVVCGTGIGMGMTANKVPGIRAAVAHDPFTARMGREHNNANVLALGGRVVEEDKAIEIVEAFLAATFAGGRHEKRVRKIDELDAHPSRSAVRS
jgi:ribose 5-phosphate isomerase B